MAGFHQGRRRADTILWESRPIRSPSSTGRNGSAPSAVELDTRLPGREEHARHAAVPARERALDLGLARLVPLHARAADMPELLSQISELPLESVYTVERRPLKGSPGLRHEGADGDVDLLAAVLSPLGQDVFDERDELVQIR